MDQDQYSYELWPGCVLVGSIAVRLDRTSQFHKPLRPIYLQYVHVQSEHLALINRPAVSLGMLAAVWARSYLL